MSIEHDIEVAAENGDSGMAIAYALLRVASALRALGNADAATPMGALEAIGAVMKENTEELCAAIHNHCEMIDNVATQLCDIAEKLPSAES